MKPEIEVGKSYKYTRYRDGYDQFDIVEKIGQYFIGTCGPKENRFLFNSEGHCIGGTYLNNPNPDWDLVIPESNRVGYKPIYNSGLVANSYIYLQRNSVITLANSVVGGFVSVNDTIPEFITSRDRLRKRLEELKITC